jgi:hypothetical protein
MAISDGDWEDLKSRSVESANSDVHCGCVAHSDEADGRRRIM